MLARTGRFDVSVNPFVPNARFPYLLKTKIFTVLVGFQGGREQVHWERMG